MTIYQKFQKVVIVGNPNNENKGLYKGYKGTIRYFDKQNNRYTITLQVNGRNIYKNENEIKVLTFK